MSSNKFFWYTGVGLESYIGWDYILHLKSICLATRKQKGDSLPRYIKMQEENKKMSLEYKSAEEAKLNFERLMSEMLLFVPCGACNKIQSTVSNIDSKLEKMYNCPGMPGYYDAKKDFEQLQ